HAIRSLHGPFDESPRRVLRHRPYVGHLRPDGGVFPAQRHHATGQSAVLRRTLLTAPAATFARIRMSSNAGTIKRLTDKGFGFIATPEGTEYFFHNSACTSTPFDSLREGDKVTFTVGQGPKGPRAENVRPA